MAERADDGLDLDVQLQPSSALVPSLAIAAPSSQSLSPAVLNWFGSRVRPPDPGLDIVADFVITYLTESVHNVVLHESIPTQIFHLTLYISNSKGQIDGFVGELTFAKRL